jgi:hypothetical protein
MVKHFRVPGSLRTRIEELGVRVSAILRRAGLPQDLFDQTRILVNTEELFALWRAIGEESKDPAIGLKLGTETKTERFHPMGLAALSTENLGAAVAHMARYKKLNAPEEILYQTDEDEWSIQFSWRWLWMSSHRYSSSIASPGYSRLLVMAVERGSLR